MTTFFEGTRARQHGLEVIPQYISAECIDIYQIYPNIFFSNKVNKVKEMFSDSQKYFLHLVYEQILSNALLYHIKMI